MAVDLSLSTTTIANCNSNISNHNNNNNKNSASAATLAANSTPSAVGLCRLEVSNPKIPENNG